MAEQGSNELISVLAPRSPQRVSDRHMLFESFSRNVSLCVARTTSLKLCASRPCFGHPARQGSGGRTAPPCVDAVAREQAEPPQGAGNVGTTRRLFPEMGHTMPDTNAISLLIFPNIPEVFRSIPTQQWWKDARAGGTDTEISLYYSGSLVIRDSIARTMQGANNLPTLAF